MVPVTLMDPVVGAAWQSMDRLTAVVWRAITWKEAFPAHWSAPSVEVAVTPMEKPVPAGRPPMTVLTLVLEVTSMEPLFANPFGPVMV
jgi:hypothetical protein